MSLEDRQKREEARRQKILHKVWWDIPPPDAPPQPLDQELVDKLAWFIKNRRQIAADHQCRKVVLHDDGPRPEFHGQRRTMPSAGLMGLMGLGLTP